MASSAALPPHAATREPNNNAMIAFCMGGW
jgi:hypothetical protein